jgi:hypothetical protein
LTFITAFSFVGVGVTDTAEAWRLWGRPYRAYYAAPRTFYYGDYRPYRSYYHEPSYYRPYYGGYYYGEPRYYYGPGSGVAVSVGF